MASKVICLCVAPSAFLLDERVFMSLGILKVAAVLEQQGYSVEMLDLSGISNYEDAVRDHVVASKAEWFGITATTPQLPAASRVAKIVREHSKMKTILGGPHVTLTRAAHRREEQLKLDGRASKAMRQLEEQFDCLVAGDGEIAIFETLRTGAKLVDADDPKSSMFLNKITLNELPFPARHLVDVKSYNYTIDGVPSCSIIGQLGCPMACNFCGGRNSPSFRRARQRTADSVVSEIKHLYGEYGYTGFMCFDESTEVLTELRGFVKFRDMSDTDKVATLDSSNRLVFDSPSARIKLAYSGDMYQFKNRYVDLLVTPEHRMWAGVKGCYKHIQAKAIVDSGLDTTASHRAKWVGKRKKYMEIPAYKTKYLGRGGGSQKVLSGTRRFKTDDWVQFMAWYLAEGSCYRPKVRNGRGYRSLIKQSYSDNKPKVIEIRDLLTRMGIHFSYSSDQFHMDSKDLYEYLKQFGHSKDKFIPQDIKDLPTRQLKLFLSAYIKGDGTTSESGQQTIASISPRMRSDLQELCIKTGRWAAEDNTYNRVLLSKQRDSLIRADEHITKSTYSGDVHCVTVPSGVVLVRRNGRAVWSGNCYDDELNINNKSFVEMMQAVIDLQKELGISFKLRGFAKSELLTQEQADLMYAAGFRWLLVGFESGSERILDNIQKKATVAQNTECMRIAHTAGLKVKALMSIGHAGETKETIAETKQWLLDVKPDDFDATIITVYPGTPYYDFATETSPGVWTYLSKSGDRLHAKEVDYFATADYYKGDPNGGYTSFVFTDSLTPEQLVEERDALEKEVREKLGIPYYVATPAQRYEHSMGQAGLSDRIVRYSKTGVK